MKANYFQRDKGGANSNFNFFFNIYALLLAISVIICVNVKAGTYQTISYGGYNEKHLWQNGYPGNIIRETDTVIIAHNITLSSDIIVKGTLIVKPHAAFTGSHHLVLLNHSKFINHGVVIVQSVTNRGSIENHFILETEADMIITGLLANHGSVVAGNILDNTGIITGNSGSIIANTRMVNSEQGRIEGKTDICCNNFSSMAGAFIDSVNVSFCGSRIFNSMFLTASITTRGVMLKLHNSRSDRYNTCHVEKSTDGIHYHEIAVIKGSELAMKQQINAVFTDTSAIQSAAVHYRLKLHDTSGGITIVPPLQIGSAVKQVAEITE